MTFSLVSRNATSLADQFRHIVTAKELGPAQCRCVMPVVTNIWIGAGIEQEASYLDSAAFGRHMERGVIYVPHRPLGVDVDAMRQQPANGGQVPLVDGNMQGDGVAAVRTDPGGTSRNMASASS